MKSVILLILKEKLMIKDNGNKKLIDTCRHIMQAFENSKCHVAKTDKRKENGENPYKDFGINSAFGVRCFDNKVIIMYQMETHNPLLPKIKFENDAEAAMKEFVSKLKTEYKKLSDKTLTLKEVGETKERTDTISLIRELKTFTKVYEIEGLKSKFEESNDDVEDYRDEVLKRNKYLFKDKD